MLRIVSHTLQLRKWARYVEHPRFILGLECTFHHIMVWIVCDDKKSHTGESLDIVPVPRILLPCHLSLVPHEIRAAAAVSCFCSNMNSGDVSMSDFFRGMGIFPFQALPVVFQSAGASLTV